MNRFEGRRSIVTGAGSGIGRAVALRLLSEGGTVVGVDIDPAGLATTAQDAAAAGTAARFSARQLDIAVEADVIDVISSAIDGLGGLDVLVNTAGIMRSGHLHEFSLETFNQVLAVNLTGMFIVTRTALPALLERKGGVVINFGSTSATFGHPYMAAYAASKGGVVAFTHSLALEYQAHNLRAVAICPGGVTTALTEAVPAGLPADANYKLFAKTTPPNGFGKPEDIAGVVAMVASDDGRYINGTEIRVDGGTHY